MPAYLAPALSLVPTHEYWASDLMPRFGSLEVVIQRGGLLLFSLCALLLAAVLRQPADGKPQAPRLRAATWLAVFGAAAFCSIVFGEIREMRDREKWLAAHQAVQEVAFPDIQSWKGDIRIVDGKQLELALEARVLPKDTGLHSILLCFNPGMHVRKLSVDGRPADFRHENGLLRIDLPSAVPIGSSAVLTMDAIGLPNPAFAYLDNAVDWRRRPSKNRLRLLGTESSIVDSRFVALMPDVCWLPVARANLEHLQRDFVDVDFRVTVPDGWLVAAPGRRQRVSQRSFRFRPEAPVAEVALVAARFESRVVEAAGIEFELLMYPGHLRNVELFADAHLEISAGLADAFEHAKRYGIPYPYKTFRVIEVPARLRGYGGGWQMATTLALPGMLLIKEHGFPIGHYATQFPEGGDPSEIAKHKAFFLKHLFTQDSGPSNAIHGVAMSLTHLTGARGKGAEALEFLHNDLVARIIGDPDEPDAWFTAHRFDRNPSFGSSVANSFAGWRKSNPFVGGFNPRFESTWVLDRTDRDPVALDGLAHHPDSRLAADLLQLQGTAISRSIQDAFGNEKTGRFLAELRERFSGRGFDGEAFSRAALDSGVPLRPLVGNWLKGAGRAGFLVSKATVSRILDDDLGKPRYQILVNVRNDESFAGLARLGERAYGGRDWLSGGWEFSAPIRIPGNTSLLVGLVMSAPPRQLWLTPYSSLNREPIRVEFAQKMAEKAVEQAPWNGTRVSDWRPLVRGVVVDDLDSGTWVELAQDRSAFDRRPRVVDPDIDARHWERLPIPGSWGKYRYTALVGSPGIGEEAIAFETQLRKGKWRLEIHVPGRRLPALRERADLRSVDDESEERVLFGELGTYHIKVDTGAASSRVRFDGAAAETGWNLVGTFDIDGPSASVRISNRTNGEAIIADAIRWTPVVIPVLQAAR